MAGKTKKKNEAVKSRGYEVEAEDLLSTLLVAALEADAEALNAALEGGDYAPVRVSVGNSVSQETGTLAAFVNVKIVATPAGALVTLKVGDQIRTARVIRDETGAAAR